MLPAVLLSGQYRSHLLCTSHACTYSTAFTGSVCSLRPSGASFQALKDPSQPASKSKGS